MMEEILESALTKADLVVSTEVEAVAIEATEMGVEVDMEVEMEEEETEEGEMEAETDADDLVPGVGLDLVVIGVTGPAGAMAGMTAQVDVAEIDPDLEAVRKWHRLMQFVSNYSTV